MGESGAPLAPEEIAEVEAAFDVIKDRLKPDSLAVIEREGLHVVDGDGDAVTPIVDGRECVYATFEEDGTAKCAFEQAHLEGKLAWRKPISCHLYPIRLTPLKDLTALNYHQWPICDAAVTCGAGLDLSILRFCKDALVRKFGQGIGTMRPARLRANGEPGQTQRNNGGRGQWGVGFEWGGASRVPGPCCQHRTADGQVARGGCPCWRGQLDPDDEIVLGTDGWQVVVLDMDGQKAVVKKGRPALHGRWEPVGDGCPAVGAVSIGPGKLVRRGRHRACGFASRIGHGRHQRLG